MSTREKFAPSEAPVPDLSAKKIFPVGIDAKIRLAPGMKWRLVEEYGPDSFEEQKDGSLLFSRGFEDRDSLFGWVLSFGEQAELLEPQGLRREFAELIKAMKKIYAGGQTR